MARKLFHNIFQDIAEAPTREDKLQILRENNTAPLRDLLACALDPKIKFDTPVPSYRESEETDGYAANTLYSEARRMYIFMDTCKHVPPTRKQQILSQILESIDVSDAALLVKIMNKNIPECGLDIKLVNEAFPGLIK